MQTNSTTREYEAGELVAWARGATFSADEMRGQNGVNMKSARYPEYIIAIDGEPIDAVRITARDDSTALRFASRLYYGPYSIFRRKLQLTHVADIDA